MKFPISAAAMLVASAFVAGCNSLDNPVPNFLSTGRDGRVFNSQTGEWEWPKEEQQKHPNSRVAGLHGVPAPEAQRKGDGRYFDLQKNQWVDAPDERQSSSKPRASSAKPDRPAPVLMTTPVPVGTPPPVRPPRASGVYNPSTGQIEWTDFDPAPRAKPAPDSRDKKWYWPF